MSEENKLTKDQLVEIAFQIIAYSGDARGIATEAIEEAREGHIEEAKKMIEEARTTVNESHNYQTELLTSEANGEQVDFSVLLIHSQDHLMTSMVVIDLAEQMINMYEMIFKMKDELSK